MKQIIVLLNCFLSTFISVIERVCVFVTTIGLFICILLIVVQVIGRYLFTNPIYWSEELARYVFIWTTLFGASLAFRRSELIGVDFFVEKLHVRNRKICKLVGLLLITGFIFIFIRYGIVLLNIAKKSNTISPALAIPMYYMYYIFPFAGVIMFIFSIASLVEMLQGKK